MASSLYIYLVPKTKKETENKDLKNSKSETREQKPLMFCSFSRNSPFYQALYENMNIAYIGNGDVPNYTTLTKESLRDVIEDLEKELSQIKEKKHIYELKANNDETLQTLAEYTEYYNEKLEDYHNICFFSVLVHDILDNFTDFEKVLCNID